MSPADPTLRPSPFLPWPIFESGSAIARGNDPPTGDEIFHPDSGRGSLKEMELLISIAKGRGGSAEHVAGQRSLNGGESC